MATCNVNDLLASAACFTCQPSGILQVLELQLLCEINNIFQGGGGGGGGALCQTIFSGNGDPTGVVVPTCPNAFYVQKDSLPANLIWTWLDGGPWNAPIT